MLTTLKDMKQSGDIVHKVRGVFSGSMSFIMNELSSGVTLSAAVAAAAEQGLCEPDPRDDLMGLDVRRKVVVLARELGARSAPSSALPISPHISPYLPISPLLSALS